MADGKTTPVNDWKDISQEEWQDVAPSAPAAKSLGDQDATFGGVARTMGGQAIEGAKGAIKGIGRSVYGAASSAINPFGTNPVANYIGEKTGIPERIHGLTEPSNTAQSIGSYLPDAAMMLAGGIGGARAILPSTVRAGRNFDIAMQAAKDVPVDVGKFAQPVLRAKQINSVAGDPMAPVIKRALTRIGPTTEPLTYADARTMASSAGRRAQQTAMGGKMTGEMGKRLSETARGLDQATAEAASKAGVGAEHNAAMNEYRNAMRLREGAKTAGKIAGPIALGAAGYRIAKGLGYLGD